MAYYTKEEVIKAKEIDLLTYLSLYEPNELVHINKDNYCTVTHDSLIISNGMWHWFSQGIGGKSALDYLIRVNGYTFLEAMEKILKIPPQEKISYSLYRKKNDKINRLLLPEKNGNNNRIRSYLINRGIDKDIIDECIDNGIIYEDKKYHNVVFLGLDDKNNPRYACFRGTMETRYLGEASGSDKAFSFRLLGKNDREIHLFESAIDLLSYATLKKMKGMMWYEDTLISLAGVYQSAKNIVNSKIPIALKRYLESNKNVKEIYLHFDNDRTGRMATEALKYILSSKYKVIDYPPKYGKDFNDFLMFYKNNLQKINDKNKERLL